MSMIYDLLLPPRTAFGAGRFARVGELAAGLGRTALVVSGARCLERDGTLARLSELLEAVGVACLHLGSIHREPRVSDVDRLGAELRRALARAADPLVVGIGGGSALDLAKALSALATHPEIESVRDALEGVGRGLRIERDPLPVLAIPTTSGTGSECTKNAVISSDPDEPRPFKKSLRSDRLVPRIVLVDPELTVSLPPDVTARTGMDAITQLAESLLSRRAQPVTSALARHGLEIALPAVERAVRRPDDLEAREAMAHAAYLSGLALANSGLGMAHGVAAALGVLADLPHGLACAMMLPAALEANREAKPVEVAHIARLLGVGRSQGDEAAAAAAPSAVRELNDRIGIPRRLGALGVSAGQIAAIVVGSRGNSMSGNPREIADDELTRILESML